ncbi:SACS [Mytilus edulis]|uniref:SACS n=1 Tax=Mytilus edulis TaxID=6550 RepID=A0A8S3U9L7_MYTED|nr:SACS [Mytilus edulis]
MASMTSMEDQETKLGGKWLTMDQPPLLKLLQNILREYPKDAQIFHELVQNADDAEATIMKLLFVPETSTSSPPEFEKYFQSPGVCVYNDALFNEVDWTNIRSVCISHKETEENKIGKYGQGFKSIFHLTETNFPENTIPLENTPDQCLIREIEIKLTTAETPSQTNKWVIVKQTDRTSNNQRDEFDIGQHCKPNITLAYHYTSSEDKPMIGGRIFNYLPLPITCITGFPVCVQGPFAISQNRRELKLPDKRSTDRFVLWNETLFQLIPSTYKLLVIYLISTSDRNGNSEKLVSTVYNCIPDIDKVETFWKPYTESIYEELVSLPLFFTELIDNHWVTKEVALNPPTDNAVPVVRTRVTTFLLDHKQPVIKIGGNIPSVLDRSEINLITPAFMVNLLRNAVMPETYVEEMRLCLLEYILQDTTLDIDGIKLIPVENGDYVCFRRSNLYDDEPKEKFLLLSDDQRRVFPGLDYRIFKTDGLSDSAYQKKYQLCCLHLDDLPMLLQSVIQQHCFPFDTDGVAEIIEDSPLTIDWITQVWKLINSFDPHDLEPFEDIHLIPRRKPASNNFQTITHLLTMKKTYLFSSYEGCPNIASNIQTILESVGVEVIPYPCDVLQPCEHLLIGNYIKIPTFDSLIQLCKNNKDLQNKIQRILGFKRTLDLPNSEITSATSFGQKEDLTTRIKGILRDHPIDHSFLNELLQNADDAGATEVHFVYDKRQHSKSNDGIFDERWEPLLGPALCVFNNACFTETDIKGIQELGIGGKCGDKSKAGQFGFGFNAVYHITDVPSFITKGLDSPGGGVFCAFDPHCKYAPYAHYDQPGMRMNLDELIDKYPSVYRSHIGDVLTSDTGTWFRFPLRNDSMMTSSELLITDNTDSETVTLQLIECMKENIVDSLIFLMNVNCITMSQINENTDNLELIKKAEVDLTKSDAQTRTRFQDSVGRNVQLLNSSYTYQCSELKEYRYHMTIKEENQHYKTYLVVQAIGLHNIDQTTRDVVNDIKRLPVGGVAVLADSSENITNDKRPKTKYRVFSTLPLPSTTGLTVHINGHFELDSSRKQLFETSHSKKQNDNRYRWNTILLQQNLSHVDWRDSATNETVQEKAGKLRQLFVNMGMKLSCGSKDLGKSFSKTCENHNGRKRHNVYSSLSPSEFVCVCKENVSPKTVSLFLKKKFNALCSSEWQTALKVIPIDDIELCLDYLLKALNWKDIIGLPLLMTDDGLVHPIQRRNEFFYLNLKTYCLECKSSGLFQKLDLVNFATLLERSQDKEILKSARIIDWNQKETRVKDKWIETFWTFFKSCQDENEDMIIPDSLHNWCLIPALFGTQTYLVPLGKGYCVADLKTFERDEGLTMIIKKLQIPESLIKPDLKESLSLLATHTDANKTFDCFQYWMNHRNVELTSHECAIILGYFGHNTGNLSKTRIRAMRKLTIFETIDDGIKQIPVNHQDIVVTAVDDAMPVQGLHYLFNSIKVTVLKYNPDAGRLYQALKFSVPSNNAMVHPISDLYATMILPHIHKLNTPNLLVHLEYILAKKLHDSSSIKEQLRKVRFIPQNDKLKSASEFFDRNIKLFKDFCEESEFPPTPFNDKKWYKLLKKPGMKTKMSKEILIEFAKRMIKIAATNLSYDAKTLKSKTIVEEIFKFIHDPKNSKTVVTSFIAEIRTISFILPQKIGEEYTAIQAGVVGDTLMRFEGSLSANRFNIVWTVRPTLPYYAMSDKPISALHVERAPCIKSVLQHTENICASLSLSWNIDQNELIETIMKDIYEYFCDNLEDESEITKTLSSIPLIHVTKHKTFVRADNIVKNLESELVPYLIQAPEQYAPFYKLFRFLGMTDTPTTKTYAKVLSNFYKDFGKGRLNIEQIKQVEKATKGLVQMLQTTMVDESQIGVDEIQTENDESQTESDDSRNDSDESRIDINESQTDIDDLILMTTDFRLVPSSEIFLETRDDERQRIMKNGTLNLIADLTIFSLNKSQIEEIFRKLPEKLRPIFARTSIHEEVISTDEVFLNSDIADKLKDYITSEHFMTGILRLAKYKPSSRNRQMGESSLLDIESNLKTIQICTVKQLQTILSLNTRRLNETEVSKRCYLDKKKNILYFTSFDVDAVKWLSLYDLELASAIEPLWNGTIEKDQILKILSKIDLNPLEFSKRLDDIGIPPMDETGIISFVPLPGSLVPKELTEFLVPLESVVPLKSFVIYRDWENTQRYKYGVVLDVILSDEQNTEYILNVGSSSPRKMHMSELFMIKEMSEINYETLF